MEVLLDHALGRRGDLLVAGRVRVVAVVREVVRFVVGVVGPLERGAEDRRSRNRSSLATDLITVFTRPVIDRAVAR